MAVVVERNGTESWCWLALTLSRGTKPRRAGSSKQEADESLSFRGLDYSRLPSSSPRTERASKGDATGDR